MQVEIRDRWTDRLIAFRQSPVADEVGSDRGQPGPATLLRESALALVPRVPV